ncbi:MAG: Ferredoxin--NADP reductase [Alphaproteobacteria bacterium MarineAlpha5_Bin9]|nr:MAG: Ferredoxin--NADP reductase [Alphaproteobacteria bacterium MarineAlpha5_Bin9]|tara:strand:+ start:7818 stop:8831 length:1014 start_codon:yes stop_codon:yes gene_type:complete
MLKTDIVIIGAGPVGLFAIFELGLLNLKCHVIDSLEQIGGQCSELYPEKPIFDIPSQVKINGNELVENLINQSKPFDPVFHLGQQANQIKKLEDGYWEVQTSANKIIKTKCIVIAAGAGSFVPRKPPLENLKEYEEKSIFYSIKDKSIFNNKKVLIAGGGDSALDWAINLSSSCDVTLLHRRKEFRASPDSVKKFFELESIGKTKFALGQLLSIQGKNGKIESITYKNEMEEITNNYQYLIPLFGLIMKLGPIVDWGLELDSNLIRVNTENFETSIPSIFAIGDINTYPGKLKLILSGFHEAALMSQKAFKYCNPEKKLIFRYTTSSKDLHKKLGLK